MNPNGHISPERTELAEINEILKQQILKLLASGPMPPGQITNRLNAEGLGISVSQSDVDGGLDSLIKQGKVSQNEHGFCAVMEELLSFGPFLQMILGTNADGRSGPLCESRKETCDSRSEQVDERSSRTPEGDWAN